MIPFAAMRRRVVSRPLLCSDSRWPSSKNKNSQVAVFVFCRAAGNRTRSKRTPCARTTGILRPAHPSILYGFSKKRNWLVEPGSLNRVLAIAVVPLYDFPMNNIEKGLGSNVERVRNNSLETLEAMSPTEIRERVMKFLKPEEVQRFTTVDYGMIAGIARRFLESDQPDTVDSALQVGADIRPTRYDRSVRLNDAPLYRIGADR